MSRLLDDLNRENCKCIKGRWYIAKPVGKDPILTRIKTSLEVLTGKAIAVHYKEDEK